jgi:hypothetical protein
MNYWMAIGIFFLGAGLGALLTRIVMWGQFRRMKAELLRQVERPESENNIGGDETRSFHRPNALKTDNAPTRKAG